MPFYSYKCNKCEEVFDAIQTIANREKPIKCKCGGTGTYVPSFKIGGVMGLPNGFAPTRSASRDKKPIGGADTK